MSLFAWSDDYLLGRAEFDEQHKQLFRMADELDNAVLEDRGPESQIGLYGRLANYLRRHLASEEDLMRQTAYPLYVQRHLEHQKLMQQVLDLQRNLASRRATLNIPMMGTLSSWLHHHVQSLEHQKFATHLRRMPA